MIRGSDGLDYENLTEKFLGNPAGTYRNGALKELRRQGTPKDEQKLWTDTYDAEYARLAALCDPSAFASNPRHVTADWEARGHANYALSAHRIAESDRRHAAPAAQDRRSPG